MTDVQNEELESAVKTVLERCPDAEEEAVRNEFKRYQKDFLIPPKDSQRSVMRKFASGDTTAGTTGPLLHESRKVERLGDLKGDDNNIEIEVRVVTYNAFTREIRGKQRDMGYGFIEDDPWGKSGSKQRWKYTDWGNHEESILPGAIVRIEGASVNEYNNTLSLNINQSSRIVVLQEGDESIPSTDEPVAISAVLALEGIVTVIGRVLSVNKSTVERKDGSGTLDLVKGQLADESGKIGYVSWTDFNHSVGDLIKIERAQIRRFRETPELNIGQYTKVEEYRDRSFADLNDLKQNARVTVSELRNGMRELDIVVEVKNWTKREFTNSDGEQRSVWSGEVIDPTGRCRISCWEPVDFIDEDALPVWLKLSSVRARAWQGIPDITVDQVSQIELLKEPAWVSLELSMEYTDVPVRELVEGGSRMGVETTATVIAVRPDSGIIHRDPESRRVLRDGDSPTNGEAVKDLRLRMVLDDGVECLSLIVNRQTTEKFLSQSMDEIEEDINRLGASTYIRELSDRLLGRPLRTRGRCIVDDQGAMFISEEIETVAIDAKAAAAALREAWGVV